MKPIRERLENWGRAYRDRNNIRRSCGSAEGRFRSNWRQWAPLHEITYSHGVDPNDARIINKAWQMMLGTSKDLLRYHYALELPQNVSARRCRFKPHQFDARLKHAEEFIAEVVDSIEKNLYKTPNNLNRETETSYRRYGGEVRPKESQITETVWLFAF